jgi:hypothetical protein
MNLMVVFSKYIGYALSAVLIVYIVTGLAYMGQFGIQTVVDPAMANYLHSNLYFLAVLIVLMALHCGGKFIVKLKNRPKRGESNETPQSGPSSGNP